MPHATCRDIADCFNRRFEATHKMRVGKTFGWEWLRKHGHEIAVLRRQIKKRGQVRSIVEF
jgi:hypothetical protein